MEGFRKTLQEIKLLTLKPWIPCGLSASSWYRIPEDQRPQPVQIPGLGKRWRVSDLIEWVEGFDKVSRRRRRKPATVTTPEPQQQAAAQG